MNKEDKTRMNESKAWCFDNNVTKEQIETAWNNALKKDVPVVKNLHKHKRTWWWLAPHLLQQLLDRYSHLDSAE